MSEDEEAFEAWFKGIEWSATCWNRREGLLTAWLEATYQERRRKVVSRGEERDEDHT